MLYLDRELFGDPAHPRDYGFSAFTEELMRVAEGFEHPQSVRDELADKRLIWSATDWNRRHNDLSILDWKTSTTSTASSAA